MKRTVPGEFSLSLLLVSLRNGCICSLVNLIPEEAEDMWHAYNLVAVGDSVRSTAIR